MTILQHHKQKEFKFSTYFKVKIPADFKIATNEKYPFKTGYLFCLADGQFVVRPKLKERTAYIISSSISNIEVIKRYN